MKHFLFFSVLIFILASCSEAPYYEQVYSFDNNEWKQDQKSVFKVNIDDTTSVYRFVLTLRTTTDYDYSNTWLFWTSETPLNEKVREPFELKIANPDGSWIGKSSGTIVENQLTFAGRKITVPGEYIFTIEQAVTEKKLNDVLDIGLSVYKE
ncbi:MAG: gliding motility lipoprotein GldH [Crocinitomicaceae bacterium]|nr:gliding motility lipoprotein GldH [Crocinitomicaceae bacterium]